MAGGVREDEFDEDYGHDDDSPPYWFPGNRMPEDALRRIGHLPQGKGLLGALIDDPHPIRQRHKTNDGR